MCGNAIPTSSCPTTPLLEPHNYEVFLIAASSALSECAKKRPHFKLMRFEGVHIFVLHAFKDLWLLLMIAFLLWSHSIQ